MAQAIFLTEAIMLKDLRQPNRNRILRAAVVLAPALELVCSDSRSLVIPGSS